MKIFIFLAAALASMNAYCGESPSQQPQKPKASAEQKMQVIKEDQTDQTDTLAIPFDTSVEEEREEQAKLDQLQKKYEGKKNVPQQQKTTPTQAKK